MLKFKYGKSELPKDIVSEQLLFKLDDTDENNPKGQIYLDIGDKRYSMSVSDLNAKNVIVNIGEDGTETRTLDNVLGGIYYEAEAIKEDIEELQSNMSRNYSWEYIQKEIQRGNGENLLPLGSLLQVKHKDYGDENGLLTFQVVAHDFYPIEGKEHSVTLMAFDVLNAPVQNGHQHAGYMFDDDSPIYETSTIRQFLNSPDKTWWTGSSPKVDYANKPGFLNGLESLFLDIIQPVKLDDSYEQGDKFYLPSFTELGFQYTSTKQILDFYRGAQNSDRIKYRIKPISVTYGATWYTRTTDGTIVKIVKGNGEWNNVNPTDSHPIAPMCTIG